jgi:hypothetical protein
MEDALAKLAVQRGILDARNLHHTYLPGELTGNIEPGDVDCTGVELVRTVDGTCNDLGDPMAGAVYTRFGRNVPLSKGFPTTSTALSPDPRMVSRTLLERRGRGEEVPFLNLWATAWTQFQIHDWFDHGPSDPSRPVRIPLAPDDPIRRATGQTHLEFGATPTDPTRTSAEASLPPTFRNHVTHWWDASQIYGSDPATAARLRTFSGGQLKLDSAGRLPLGARGVSDAGFTSNWWVGLELLHEVFVKEHNAIAVHLKAKYPGMTDQELYDTSRLINAALIAKIHTLEWTPAILPNKTLDVAMNANWYGLQKFVPDPVQKATLAAVAPPPNAVLWGIVGGTTDNKGVPFSMTSEFAAIYRMHQLVPDSFKVRELGKGKVLADVDTVDTTNAGARDVRHRMGLQNLAWTFGRENANALVLKNYPRFMTNLDLPTGNKLDLAAVDLYRDRERGIPRYNEFRRQIGLPALTSFAELTPDIGAQRAISKAYGGDIEKLDLFVGTLAEGQRPDCFGFGETLFQTFILMASRRLQADRFYTEDFTDTVYTPEGLAWVENNTFKTVLLRHVPSLASTGLVGANNPFAPWNDEWSVSGSCEEDEEEGDCDERDRDDEDDEAGDDDRR